MRLRDLATGSGAGLPVAVDAACTPSPPPASLEGQSDPRWVVVESRLLEGERILVVFEKKDLKEAESAHPDKVIYFPPEIDELRRHKDTAGFPQLLRTVHLVKKRLGGWVVPSSAPKGGDNRRGTAKRRGKAR